MQRSPKSFGTDKLRGRPAHPSIQNVGKISQVKKPTLPDPKSNQDEEFDNGPKILQQISFVEGDIR